LIGTKKASAVAKAKTKVAAPVVKKKTAKK
jgi:hypothetical protein